MSEKLIVQMVRASRSIPSGRNGSTEFRHREIDVVKFGIIRVEEMWIQSKFLSRTRNEFRTVIARRAAVGDTVSYGVHDFSGFYDIHAVYTEDRKTRKTSFT